MISAKIKNPKPYKLFGFVPYHERRDRQQLPHMQQVSSVIPIGPPRSNPVIHDVTTVMMPKDWDKLAYTRWVESVKREFSKGDLVTMKVMHHIAGKIPLHFKVIDILEVQAQVKWDSIAWEPRALVVEFNLSGRIIDPRAPSTMRKLNTEELALVDLQNTKPQGSA